MTPKPGCEADGEPHRARRWGPQGAIDAYTAAQCTDGGRTNWSSAWGASYFGSDDE